MTDEVTIAGLCSKGIERLDAGAAGEALSLFEQARILAPENARVHYLVAVAHVDRRDLGRALAALEISLQLDPTDAKAHNNLGSTLQQLGRLSDAEASYRRAIAINPQLPQPYLNLGKVLEQMGASAQAVAIYDQAIGRGLDAEMFAQNKAAVLGHDSARSPNLWVKSTFDNFAPTFEQHLHELGYDIPRELARLAYPKLAPNARIADLGCGTGLVGTSLARRDIRLVGVDLSPRMLAIARQKAVYADCREQEVHDFLREQAAGSLDGAIAADVLIYIGNLMDLFAELKRTLRRGGFFAFSTEECVGDDYRLLPTGRYAHSHSYVSHLAAEDLYIETQEPCQLRLESGRPVAGCVHLLVRR